jgi:hypothetical protein
VAPHRDQAKQGSTSCGLDIPQAALPLRSDGYGNRTSCDKEHAMMDVLMLALAIGFFALAIGYTYACERL